MALQTNKKRIVVISALSVVAFIIEVGILFGWPWYKSQEDAVICCDEEVPVTDDTSSGYEDYPPLDIDHIATDEASPHPHLGFMYKGYIDTDIELLIRFRNPRGEWSEYPHPMTLVSGGYHMEMLDECRIEEDGEYEVEICWRNKCLTSEIFTVKNGYIPDFSIIYPESDEQY